MLSTWLIHGPCSRRRRLPEGPFRRAPLPGMLQCGSVRTRACIGTGVGIGIGIGIDRDSLSPERRRLVTIPDTDRDADSDPDIETDSRSTPGFRVTCIPSEH